MSTPGRCAPYSGSSDLVSCASSFRLSWNIHPRDSCPDPQGRGPQPSAPLDPAPPTSQHSDPWQLFAACVFPQPDLQAGRRHICLYLSSVPSTVLVWSRCSVVTCGRREEGRIEGRTEGRKKGWKERKEEGRKLGQKSVVASTPRVPLVCQACNLSLAHFLFSLVRGTPQEDSAPIRETAGAKSPWQRESPWKSLGVKGDPWRDGGSFPLSFICHHCQESISQLSPFIS